MIYMVNMPGAEVTRPSLALGILKARLSAAGARVRNLHANLLWFERIGPDLHQDVIGTAPSDMLIEWVFAGAAFPEHEGRADAFAAMLRERDGRLSERPVSELVARLSALRDDAVAFVATVADEVMALEPTVVGCTSMFQQHTASLALLREVKRRAPHVVTVLGGANCEAEMGRATHRNCPWVDFLMSGEADIAIAELWDVLGAHGGEAPAETLPHGLFGPVHRRQGYPRDPRTGRPPRAVVDDLRDAPTPNYDDYFEQLARSPVGPMIVAGLPFETSRGCWWGERHHCTFCGLNGSGMNFRARTPQAAADEVRTLQRRYGVDRLEAVDNILSMGFFDTVLPDLASDGVRRHLFFETKANLRARHIDALAEAGVRWIQPGIESLDTRVLTLMRKGTTALQNVRLLRDCAQRGVDVIWSFIIGFPGEEDAWHEDAASLVGALHHLSPGGIAGLRFDRFSPYERSPETWGLELVPAAPYAAVYPYSASDLADQAYYLDAVDRSAPTGDLRFKCLDGFPGARRLRDALAAWQSAHAAGARLELRSGRSGEGASPGAHVSDTREGEELVVPVDQVGIAVLDACADGVRFERAIEAVVAAGHAAEAARASLHEALARRWVVALDERVLSVVLRAPVEETMPRICFPGGTLLRPEFAL